MYQLLESEGPKIIQIKATTDATTSSEAYFLEVTSSFPHKISTRVNILPYTDMVKWIIYNINIFGITFQYFKTASFHMVEILLY